MKKPSRKHWKKLTVHPALHTHIMKSPILAPYAMGEDEPAGQEAGEGPESMESMPPAGGAPAGGGLASV